MTQVVADEVLGKIAREQHDLFRRVRDGTLLAEQVSLGLQALIEGRFGARGIDSSHPDFSPVLLPLELWARLYRDLLKLPADVVRMLGTVWQKPKPGCWNVPMLPGLTQNGLVGAMRQLGITVWTYVADLDAGIPDHDRDPNKTGPYLVSFRARKEADAELQNLSVNQLQERGIKGITNPERLFLGLGFYQATEGEADLNQRHLDEKSITLCSGSRYSDGGVPGVDWDPDDRRVCVGWWNLGSRYAGLRSREAVPL